jgi:ketosteroid isomerase-like protein
MSQVGCLSFLAVLFACGCVSVPGPNLNADYPEDQAQIQLVLKDIFDAAQKKEFARLDAHHFYGPKFTKFDDFEPLARQHAVFARKSEHEGLGGITELSMKAEDLKIDVFGNVAVATFVLVYGFTAGPDVIKTKARSTMVFVKDQRAWKIAHEHFSAFKSNP